MTGLPLDAECVRCFPCRKKGRDLKALHHRYQQLVSQEERTPEQDAELALLRLELMQAGLFGSKHADAVRAFLHRHPDHPEAADIRSRLAQLAKDT